MDIRQTFPLGKYGVPCPFSWHCQGTAPWSIHTYVLWVSESTLLLMVILPCLGLIIASFGVGQRETGIGGCSEPSGIFPSSPLQVPPGHPASSHQGTDCPGAGGKHCLNLHFFLRLEGTSCACSSEDSDFLVEVGGLQAGVLQGVPGSRNTECSGKSVALGELVEGSVWVCPEKKRGAAHLCT